MKTLSLLMLTFMLGETLAPAYAATNTIYFNYADRSALLAAGWSFMAQTAGGVARNTETSDGTTPPDVSYDQTAHPGVLLISPLNGDLWATGNDTKNSIFTALSSNWLSVMLTLEFSPTDNVQQANLVLYQDDDNYIEISRGYNGGGLVGFVRESNGGAAIVDYLHTTATNVQLRLDRDLSAGDILASYSENGTAWTSVGQISQALVNPRLGIWVGGSFNNATNFPNAGLRRLDIVTNDTPVTTMLIVQPAALVFNSVAGQPCPTIQNVNVINRGPNALNWTLANPPSWLLVSSTNGPASGVASGSFDVAVDPTGLVAGIYQTNLVFTAPGAANSPLVLPATLIVNPAARAGVSVWKGGKNGALSVSVDDGQPSMFAVLSTNGFAGTYVMNGTEAPAFFNTYHQAGMELGMHLVDHSCAIFDEPTLRAQIEPNRAGVCATMQPCADVISLAWTCGIVDKRMESVAADYVLSARGFNLNMLEDPTPHNFMNLNSFSSHGFNPLPPADFKTVVDDAIAQGKWANLVFHGVSDDDGAVAYSVGKDIWVAPIGTVVKYILQRDRTVISNYVETASLIGFDCYRLPLTPSSLRSFETAIHTNDLVTLHVDASGIQAVLGLSVDGVATTNYVIRTVGVATMLFVDVPVMTSVQRVAVAISTITNHPPLLATNANVTLGEGQMLVITNTASDPDTNALMFTLGAGAPAGMTISTNGVLSWTPGETDGGSDFTVTVEVRDNGFPSLSASNSFTVAVHEINVAPVLPALPDRTIIGQTLLVVANAATDADIPANPLGYTLLTAPTNAVISASGVITWMPSAAQVPGVYTFTTVVTDTNLSAANAQHLSATNSFTVTVVASPLLLPAQTNRTIAEFVTLVVTNTATDFEIADVGNVGQLTTNTISFTYTNREALLADGWDYIARTTNGVPRNTETTNGLVVSYDQAAHPGVLRIPCDDGDLWGVAYNSTRNQLLRNLSSNWVSLRLELFFAPTQNVQQAHLLLYQDDDNYVQAGLAYNTGLGGEAAAMVAEFNGMPTHFIDGLNSVTNMHQRLDRDPVTGNISVLYSIDGTNWALLGQASQSFLNPRLAIWTGGGNPVSPASLDLLRLDIVVTNAPKYLTYQLLNPPAGAAINSTNGLITWTPAEAQGPSTNVFTTIVTDNGVSPLFTTNSFTVVVTEVNTAPVLSARTNQIIAEHSLLTVTNAATDADIPALTLSYTLTGPAGASIDTNGVITWTPSESQGPGTNVLKTVVSDGELTATNEFTVVVTEVNVAPVLGSQPNRTLVGLESLVVTNAATDADEPVQALSYTLSGPAGAVIDTNGVITWMPGLGDVPGTNGFVTVASDGALTATNVFIVTVLAPEPPPVIKSIHVSAGVASVMWSSVSNRIYRLEYNEDLGTTNWIAVPPDVLATEMTTTATNALGASPQRFYRIRVMP